MKPRISIRKTGVILAGICAAFLTLGAFDAAQAATAAGTIRFDRTGFNHMNTQLVRGSTLHFSNPSARPLHLAIVTWRGRKVDTLTLAAHGGTAAWKPVKNGVYVFYDTRNTSYGDVPLAGEDGEKVYQPVARKHSPDFPAPVYGIVAVTAADGGGIPLSRSYGPMEVPGKSSLTGKHEHPFMHNTKDMPWIEVPGGTMTFKPWVLVVRAGTPIHVFDYDMMDHAFFPGHYPVMYLDHGKVSYYHHTFSGFILQSNGGHHVITFDKPGLYHILCIIHSYAWKHTYKSHRFYGGFPYVMDAVVVVEPAKRTG
ncbi:cupredoxin domain-containing protein [Acidihalobacter ferrooxydans]|uniref:Plastocyanin-like domain-containing protein n=1 Tax=Acidihalobacter ferrooxydans TaxID=1765967 RepID=A0A1P8UDR0_9GAMM|nr:hypothetical protein [Acidihalobacter ferrooxydans]APZ41936.1 hypothetical protein BW247_01520 [Acidihalobacter ferrooxydans]